MMSSKAKLLLLPYVASIIMFIVCPTTYSTQFVDISFVIGIIEIFIFFRIQKKESYFDFDTIFLLLFVIASYTLPVFVYRYDLLDMFFFRGDNLYYNRLSKSVAISTIAIGSYCLGSLSVRPNLQIIPQALPIITKPISILFLFLTLLSISMGSVEISRSGYMDYEYTGSSHVFQIMSVNTSLYLFLLGTQFYNLRFGKKIDLFFLSATIIHSLGMLYAGNRTSASIYLLPFIFYFFYYYRKIRLWEFVLLMVVAFVAMWVLQITRSGNEVEEINGIQTLSDIVRPSRLNATALEYVDKNGYLYGLNFLGIVGIVPGLYSALARMGFDVSVLDSAMMFTIQELGKNPDSGIGTTLQADVYLSFGLFGVIFFFYFIGKFVKVSYERMKNGNLYYFIIYAVFMSYSVYWVRSSLMIFIKPLFWSLVFSYLAYRHTIKKYGKNTHI